MTGGKSVFTMKKAKIATVVDAFLIVCKNEDKLMDSVTAIVKIIEDRLAEMGVMRQERIRDTIRSETFSTIFRDQIVSLLTEPK